MSSLICLQGLRSRVRNDHCFRALTSGTLGPPRAYATRPGAVCPLASVTTTGQSFTGDCVDCGHLAIITVPSGLLVWTNRTSRVIMMPTLSSRRGGAGGCSYDNLHCHHWRQISHHDNSRSVTTCGAVSGDHLLFSIQLCIHDFHFPIMSYCHTNQLKQPSISLYKFSQVWRVHRCRFITVPYEYYVV